MDRKPKVECLMEGLACIRKYDPECDIAAEHDIFYAGDYAKTALQMTEAERAVMGGLGWFEKDDGWALYV